MSSQRFVDTLTDADRRAIREVETELRRALTVLPSPQFSREVRARVAARTARGRPSAACWIGIAATAATLIVARMAAPPTHEVERLHPGRTATSAANVQRAGRSPAAPQLEARHTVTTARHASAPPRRPATAAKPRGVAPEVIVPPERARAIALFVELANRGAVHAVDVPNDTSADALVDLAPAPITLAPITIPDVIIENSRARSGTGLQ